MFLSLQRDWCSTSISSFVRSVFDRDESGAVDAEEFTLIIDELRSMANIPHSSAQEKKE
jgi:hypothetical protein